MGEEDANQRSAGVLLHVADDCMEVLLNALPMQAAQCAGKHVKPENNQAGAAASVAAI